MQEKEVLDLCSDILKQLKNGLININESIDKIFNLDFYLDSIKVFNNHYLDRFWGWGVELESISGPTEFKSHIQQMEKLLGKAYKSSNKHEYVDILENNEDEHFHKAVTTYLDIYASTTCLTYKDKTKTLSEWANITGYPLSFLIERLDIGLPVEKILGVS